MDSQNISPLGTSRSVPAVYRAFRALARVSVWFRNAKIRLLNEERLTQGDAAILLASYPESFWGAILAVAALSRQVHCLVSAEHVRGLFQKLAARGLGMIIADPGTVVQSSAGGKCLKVLASRGVIVAFAGQPEAPQTPCTARVVFCAELALQATRQSPESSRPLVCALHWYLPYNNGEPEALGYVEGPIQTIKAIAQDSQTPAEAIQKAVLENVFGLEKDEVEQFHRDLETILREDVEKDWRQLPDWKQSAADLELSGFIKRWIDEQNRTDPGRLVGLRQSVNAYNETRRRCSLERFRVDTAGLWRSSNFQIAEAWVESALGLPVALYGLANHLVAGGILLFAGLLKRSRGGDPKVEWLWRTFIVLSCYTVQVFLVNRGLGRAAAGYYTLTLPVSGAYLWRYLWLAKNRTRALLSSALLPAWSARLARAQGRIMERIDLEAEKFAQSVGVPY